LKLALDATYSLDRDVSGVGVYSREILNGLALAHSETPFLFCYRAHRLLKSIRATLPGNARRAMLGESSCGRPWGPWSADLFHGLNQRLPRKRFRLAVATFHDLFVLTGDYSTKEFRERFARQARDAALRADLIIAVSAFTAGQVEQLLGVEPARLRVIHHGVRVRASSNMKREPVVLHIGAIQRRKNIARLVDAFSQMPSGWRLVLAGACGYGAGEILQHIERSPRRASIDLPGYVTDRELADLYAKASIFAFPSLDEGFGMPALDAMANGVPVLAGTRSALPEICGDAALLVNPEDTAAIAGGLTRLATEHALRDGLRALGLTRAQQFSWEQAVEQTWEVYRELLGSPLA
jgi:glycosyltransferase involved in cell wall biosynthesis